MIRLTKISLYVIATFTLLRAQRLPIAPFSDKVTVIKRNMTKVPKINNGLFYGFWTARFKKLKKGKIFTKARLNSQVLIWCESDHMRPNLAHILPFGAQIQHV
jgi:hypothetical protein